MQEHVNCQAEQSDGDADSVLSKVRLILESFGPDDLHLGITEIARRSGVPKASVHRLAQELVKWGVLERRGSGYWLGLRLFELGQRVPRHRILHDAARPYMEDLHQSTGETIHLGVLEGREVLYLEKVYGHEWVPLPSRVAGRMPLHSTATGRVLLAFGSRQLQEVALVPPLRRFTRYTVTSPSVLMRELAQIRDRRYATEFEQTQLGWASVAVPLTGPSGTVIGALSVTAPTYRARANAQRYVTLLAMVTRQIEKTVRDGSGTSGDRGMTVMQRRRMESSCDARGRVLRPGSAVVPAAANSMTAGRNSRSGITRQAV
jgi:DNA-binding IclR family transcriptional regulator